MSYSDFTLRRVKQDFNLTIVEETTFGTVTTGDRWKFLKLESNTVTIGLLEYNLPPVEQVLGILVSFVAHY